MLTSNGVVIQQPDGSIEAVNKGQAREHLDALSPAARALYEKIESQK
jgi:hypothetical protein